MIKYYVRWTDMRTNPFTEHRGFIQKALSLPHAARLITVLQAMEWAGDIHVFSFQTGERIDG